MKVIPLLVHVAPFRHWCERQAASNFMVVPASLVEVKASVVEVEIPSVVVVIGVSVVEVVAVSVVVVVGASVVVV